MVRELRDGSTSKVVVDILGEVFNDFGTPAKIVSDNGPQFSNRQFTEFCLANDIQRSTSSSLHSPGKGQVERMSDTIKSMMRKYI